MLTVTPRFKSLFGPIVKRLGYEYSEAESVDTRELRTRAITQAALAGDKECVEPFSIFVHGGLSQSAASSRSSLSDSPTL